MEGVVQSLTLDLTYNCNFNYSGEHDLGIAELSDNEVLSLCADIIKIKPLSMCICGGEPLLRKDLLYKIIDKISKGTNNFTKINMVTNGYLLTENVAQSLKSAGIQNVQVSLDGIKSSTHDWIRNKEGAYNAAVNAIKILNEANVESAVSCVPTKRNINEYEDLIEFCIDNSVEMLT